MKHYTMKNTITTFVFLLACVDWKQQIQTIALAYGKCKFGLTSEKAFSLAGRLDGKAYFIDSADIHDLGDAHHKEIGFEKI
jgi:hypothetical protein